MSDPTFHTIYGSANPNHHPSNYHTKIVDDHVDVDHDDDNYYNLDFDISTYIAMVDHHHEDSTSGFNACLSQGGVTQEMTSTGSTTSSSFNGVNEKVDMQVKYKRGMRRIADQVDDGRVFVFRTKTELEILDDGYKWRKYGKKKVKSNTNPRHYYKCMNPGCNVKKRVERDGEDSSNLLTSYEGVHNHESPCLVQYNKYMPSTLPNEWSLQASQYYG